MHTNPDVLALLALGEDVGDQAERDHVRSCPECSREVAEFSALAGIARSSTPEDTLTRPSPEVWDRVRADLGFDQPATVTPLEAVRERRQRVGLARTLPWMALAAVLALLAGFGIGVAWQQRPGPEQQQTVVASTPLEAFPKYPGSTGQATLETDGQGHQTLVVEVETTQPVEDLQVWLIHESGDGMRSLGFVNSAREEFEIPEGMALSQFPIVDISDEPLNDRNPAHSGNTVVRGTLEI